MMRQSPPSRAQSSARRQQYDEFEELEEEHEEGGSPQLNKKKPARRSKRAREGAASKAAAAAAAAAPAAPAPAPVYLTAKVENEPRTKRSYQKTGMHSKDPQTAELARARAGGKAPPAPAVPTTPIVLSSSAGSSSRGGTPFELAELARIKQQNQDFKAELK
eukprot:922998-Pleurochrysis_carterae.AAC.1